MEWATWPVCLPAGVKPTHTMRIAEICVNGPLQTHLPWPAITRGSREVLEVKEACALKLGRLEGIKGGVRGKNLGRISIFPKEVALIQSKPITYRILKTTKTY